MKLKHTVHVLVVAVFAVTGGLAALFHGPEVSADCPNESTDFVQGSTSPDTTQPTQTTPPCPDGEEGLECFPIIVTPNHQKPCEPDNIIEVEGKCCETKAQKIYRYRPKCGIVEDEYECLPDLNDPNPVVVGTINVGIIKDCVNGECP